MLPGRKWDIALTCVAVALALAAITVSALHLVPPHLTVGKLTLSIARKHIVQPKEQADFEFLAANQIWEGKKLGTLLEHVELANYNRELIDWKLEDVVYQDYVLSPEIDPERDGDMDWRRPLWESFYPRIRKQQTTTAAAEIVARYLRERVTIIRSEDRNPKSEGSPKPEIRSSEASSSIEHPATSNPPPQSSNLQPATSNQQPAPHSISGAWKSQITDPHGFDCLYVAAMRSAGIPARLDAQARPEFWTGAAWQLAPRPLIETSWRTEPERDRPRSQ